MNTCDFHLSKAAGNFGADQHGFGGRIRDAQKRAAAEWIVVTEVFLPHADDLAALPDGSWLLQVDFRLAQPFTSKAEGVTEWLEVLNPIGRDHLTGLPVVRPTTWKGNLLFAARAEELEDTLCHRLFGITRGNEAGQAGRLHFFPTFFSDQTGREVVTPLSRDTRTPVRGPIDFEVIPASGEGRFNLLYLPRPKGAAWHLRQIAEDLLAAASAASAMLLEYGFSAKKTSGWGVAEDALISGTLITKGPSWPVTETAGAGFVQPDEGFRNFMEANGAPKAVLKRASGEWLSNQDYKKSETTLGSLSEYKKFRVWYETHGSSWMRSLVNQAKMAKALQQYKFSRISELPALADKLARGFREAIGG
jgi:CRISPR-associated protein Cmr2